MEKQIDWNDYVGKWGKFWDYDKDNLLISKLYDFQKDEFNSVSCPDWFKNFEPLTEEQIKILELE